MDDIRQNILREQEMRKARLRCHFDKAFNAQKSANGKDIEYSATQGAKEVNSEVEYEACKGKSLFDDYDDTTCKAEEYSDFGIPKYGDIEKGGDRIWNGDEYVSPQDFLFKARVQRNVGDRHPQHPNWIWTEWAPGKFDWKSEKGKHHQSKQGGQANNPPQPKQPTQKTTDDGGQKQPTPPQQPSSSTNIPTKKQELNNLPDGTEIILHNSLGLLAKKFKKDNNNWYTIEADDKHTSISIDKVVDAIKRYKAKGKITSPTATESKIKMQPNKPSSSNSSQTQSNSSKTNKYLDPIDEEDKKALKSVQRYEKKIKDAEDIYEDKKKTLSGYHLNYYKEQVDIAKERHEKALKKYNKQVQEKMDDPKGVADKKKAEADRTNHYAKGETDNVGFKYNNQYVSNVNNSVSAQIFQVSASTKTPKGLNVQVGRLLDRLSDEQIKEGNGLTGLKELYNSFHDSDKELSNVQALKRRIDRLEKRK